jgi:hypothetical protein
VINETLAECDIVVVVIGPHWLDATDGEGLRRLERTSDTHRLEVAAALNSDALVVPVLVEGATHPSEQDLPDELKDLAYLQSWELGQRNYNQDVEELAQELLTARRRKRAERVEASAQEKERAEAAAKEKERAEAAAKEKERAEAAAESKEEQRRFVQEARQGRGARQAPAVRSTQGSEVESSQKSQPGIAEAVLKWVIPGLMAVLLLVVEIVLVANLENWETEPRVPGDGLGSGGRLMVLEFLLFLLFAGIGTASYLGGRWLAIRRSGRT